MSKGLGSLIFFIVPEKIVHSFLNFLLIYFRIVYIWTMYHSLDKRIWFVIIFLPLKGSHSVPNMDFFVKFSLILSQLELSREEFTKLTQVFWWKFWPCHVSWIISSIFISAAYRAGMFVKFIFELEASSYSFKITSILLRQVIYLRKWWCHQQNLIFWSHGFLLVFLWSSYRHQWNWQVLQLQ